MANAKSKKKPSMFTPPGIAAWVKVMEPDTKFKKEGEYSVQLCLKSEAAQPLVAQIDEAMEASYQTAVKDPNNKGKKIKRADPPYKVDEETGDVTFKFKMKASGADDTGRKWTQRPFVVDSNNTVIPDRSLKIGGGSVMIVSFIISEPWNSPLAGAGVTLKLKGVQLLKLVEWTPTTRFEKQEGYTYVAPDTSNDAEDEAPAGDGDADPNDHDF